MLFYRYMHFHKETENILLNEGYGTKTSLSTVIGFETLEVDRSSTPSTKTRKQFLGVTIL